MASVAVGHALIATKSTHSSAAIDSARSRSLKTGRPPGPPFRAWGVRGPPRHALLELHLGRPSEDARVLGDVAVRDVGLTGALGEIREGTANEISQRLHALRRAGRYVEHFPIDVRDGGRDEGLHDIGDEDEITLLAPVADDGEGSAVRALGEEDAEDGAICAGRA